MTEHVYIDIVKGYEPGNRYANYRQQFDKAILPRACDYSLSIDRFNIPMTAIPIFIFNHQYELREGNNGGVYYNYYNISMSYNDVYSDPMGVQFIPSSTNISQYDANDPDNTDPVYYYVWNVAQFIRMLNETIKTAFSMLSDTVTLPIGATYPFFTIDYSSNTLLYYAQRDFYDVDNVEIPIKLYLNTNLWNMLKGFNYLVIGGLVSPVDTGRDVQLLCFNMNNNLETFGGTASTNYYYKMVNEFGAITLINWNIAKGFFMTSNNLPVRNELLPSLSSSWNASTQQYTIQKSNVLVATPIICSFDFIYTPSEPFPLNAQYVLNSPYKLIDMTTISPITSIDVSVFWFDKYNNAYPLKFYRDEAMSIRILFQKIKDNIKK
jgi:hypothetical protein